MSGKNNSSGIFSDLLSLKIFQTFRIARHHTKLTIAFAALVVIFLAGWIMDLNKTVVDLPGNKAVAAELQIYLTSPKQLQSFIEAHRETGRLTGVFSTLWHFAHSKFHGALKSLFALDLPAVAANIAEYCKAVGWAFRYHTVYCVIFSAIKLAVIAVAGGAICRIAALQFARGEKPGLTEALRFSFKKFLSFFAAPLLPAAVVLFLTLCVAVVGLLGFIPWLGELLIALPLLMGLVLLAGFIMALLVIGMVAGFNLMFPVIAYEGSDCFEAVERSFTYIFRKPWHIVFYTAVAAVYGAICYVFVRFFAFLVLFCAHQALPLGARFIYWLPSRLCGLFGVKFAPAGRAVEKLLTIWPQPSFLNLLGTAEPAANWSPTVTVAAFLIKLCLFVIAGLVMAFVVSFYFSANTIIYSLLRKGVDGVALEDVHTELEEAELASVNSGTKEPNAQSQPPAQTDS